MPFSEIRSLLTTKSVSKLKRDKLEKVAQNLELDENLESENEKKFSSPPPVKPKATDGIMGPGSQTTSKSKKARRDVVAVAPLQCNDDSSDCVKSSDDECVDKAKLCGTASVPGKSKKIVACRTPPFATSKSSFEPAHNTMSAEDRFPATFVGHNPPSKEMNTISSAFDVPWCNRYISQHYRGVTFFGLITNYTAPFYEVKETTIVFVDPILALTLCKYCVQVMYEDGQIVDMAVEEVQEHIHLARVPFDRSFLCMKHFVQLTESSTKK
jgi:hypothetical protein